MQAFTHPPSLQSPVPPFAARVYFGSAHRERPSEPLLKYEPARQMMTYSKARVALFMPRLAYDGETLKFYCLKPKPPIQMGEWGGGVERRLYLSADKCWSDVEMR